MFKTIKKLFGKDKTDYDLLMKDGAIILDVRSKAEFATGHIRGSINVPVDQMHNALLMLTDRSKTIITCCASGIRSESAKKILQSNGFSNVHNGGAWSSLQNKI